LPQKLRALLAPSLQDARTPMPRGIHNSRRGPKPLPPNERAARRRAALKRARTKQLQKEKAATAARRRTLAEQRRRNCPAALTLTPIAAVAAGLSLVRRTGAPLLTYIDHSGRVCREDFRSAEQLIADYEKTRQKKGSHNPA